MPSVISCLVDVCSDAAAAARYSDGDGVVAPISYAVAAAYRSLVAVLLVHLWRRQLAGTCLTRPPPRRVPRQ